MDRYSMHIWHLASWVLWHRRDMAFWRIDPLISTNRLGTKSAVVEGDSMENKPGTFLKAVTPHSAVR